MQCDLFDIRSLPKKIYENHCTHPKIKARLGICPPRHPHCFRRFDRPGHADQYPDLFLFLAIPDQLADNSIRNRILASIEENPFNQFYEYAIAKNVY